MTTQEPVEDPGLDALRDAFLDAQADADEANFHGLDDADELSSSADAAFLAIVAHIEAQAIAPWREALRRYTIYEEVFGYEQLAEEFGPEECPGTSWSMEAWMDRVLRDPARTLLHPNAEGGD